MAKKFRFPVDATALAQTVFGHEPDLDQREQRLVGALARYIGDRDVALEDYINTTAGVPGPPGPAGGAAVYQDSQYTPGPFITCFYAFTQALDWGPLNNGPAMFTFPVNPYTARPVNSGMYHINATIQRQDPLIPLSWGITIQGGGGGGGPIRSALRDWAGNAAETVDTLSHMAFLNTVPATKPLVQVFVTHFDPAGGVSAHNYKLVSAEVTRMF